MPQVSIVVPVYNCESYMERSLDSILSQSYSDFELILVNDGSTDGSGAICDRVAERDSRVRVIHKENGGAGSARNAGIEAAEGLYILFPDADDYYEPDMLRTMLEAEEKTEADLVICGYHCFDEKGPCEDVVPEARLLETAADVRQFFTGLFPHGLVGYPWNKLYKKEMIDRFGLRFTDMRRFQDGVFNLAYFEHVETCCVLDQALYHYRVNNIAGIFRKFPGNIFDLLCEITDAYYDKLDEWQLRDSRAEREILPFFLNGIVSCVDSMYSPQWGFSHRQRKEYLRMLADNETVRYCTAKRPETLGRYAALVVELLEKRRIRSLLALGRCKVLLKQYGNGLFRKLKGVSAR